jgi:predicted permease
MAILPIPLHLDARPDLNIVLATTAFAMLSAVAFGLAPALKITKPDLVDDLKDLGASHRPSRRFGTRAWLVVCQIAMSLMLMTAGGLFARGALRAGAADPGYRYDRLLLASIDPSLAGYGEAQGRARVSAALERVRRLPGVAAVGASSQVPFGDFHEGHDVARASLANDDRPARHTVTYTTTSSDYFRAIGLPILRGRDFTLAEEAAASPAHVAIVDEPLARELFAGEDPIGQQLVLPARSNEAPTTDNAPLTIVGIVPGIRDELFEPKLAAHLYVPPSGRYRSTMHLHVRTTGGSDSEMLAAIRRELRAVDERLPIVELRTMRDFHERGLSLWVIRAAGRTLSGLGVLALLLASIGVYGVKSYVVSQRTREIGIRLALGAAPRDIAWMLLRDGARMVIVGVAIGFPLAVALGRLLSAAMFEVSALDPLVLTIAPLVLASAAAAATYLPARRGMRVSPLDALRIE